jgi:hypothetical protein
MLRSLRFFALAALAASVLTVACGDDSNPNTPTSTTTTTSSVAPALTAPVAKSPTGGTEITGFRPVLEVENAKATGNVGTVTYHFEISEVADFPEGSRTVVLNSVPQGDGSTSAEVPQDLQANFLYYWRARATNGTITTDYTNVETVRTENRGFLRGNDVYDPLVKGTTLGAQVGGTFVMGEGWRSNGLNDGIRYDVPTLTNGQIEFDATNFDRATDPIERDLKWMCAGDADQWDFVGFRNGPHKAQLEKKSGPGEEGEIKFVFRIDYDDNEERHPGLRWEPIKVYRFRVQWGYGSVQLFVGEVQPNGTANMEELTSSGYGANYDPSPHRLELGCTSRGETLPGAIWRNVRIRPR